MTTRRGVVISVLAAIAVAGCADSAQGDPAHPSVLAGRWLRLRADGSWGDTMTFSPDGTLLGSQGYPVPQSLHWNVKPGPKGVPQYCADESGNGFCRDYEILGDTLRMFGGPLGTTTFRRVP
jgi:hypothetical protein